LDKPLRMVHFAFLYSTLFCFIVASSICASH
jgi:hypothetical protein